MPLPVQNLNQIVNEVLEEAGVIPPKTEFSNSLQRSGVTIENLAAVLADLLYNGKENTRLRALQLALAAYGIDLQPKTEFNLGNQIVVNLKVTGNFQENNLFSPERKLNENVLNNLLSDVQKG
ncbi:MAG: hypothetical protein ACUVQP_00030 [Bacteroidales bacterium]